MAIQNIHKQAILKLINEFTTIINHRHQNSNDTSSSSNIEEESTANVLFKDSQASIDLSSFTRLGLIISKFEQLFRPNSLIINGGLGNSKAITNGINNQSWLYLQQLNYLVEFVESNELQKLRSTENLNSLEALQLLQTSPNVQMLILLIRDWLLQFYLDKNFVYELFPSTATNDEIIFSLINIKENNIVIIALLIFNIFYKLRHSFPKYQLLLDFSWICFTDLEPYIGLANVDLEYIITMLQSSLLSARIEDDQNIELKLALNKQIESFTSKILDSSKKPTIKGINFSEKVVSKTSLQQASTNHLNKLVNHQKYLSTAHSKTLSTKLISSTSNSNMINDSNDLKNIKLFKCEECSKVFPTSYKLNRHSYSHSGLRPYLCPYDNCLKRFNDNYHLKRHINTHTGEKPYDCKNCSKRYSRAEDLRNHQKTHFDMNANKISSMQSFANNDENFKNNRGLHLQSSLNVSTPSAAILSNHNNSSNRKPQQHQQSSTPTTGRTNINNSINEHSTRLMAQQIHQMQQSFSQQNHSINLAIAAATAASLSPVSSSSSSASTTATTTTAMI